MGLIDWLGELFCPGAKKEAEEYDCKMDNIEDGIANLRRNNEALSEKNKTLIKQLESACVDCETISNLQAHCQELNREKAALVEKAERLQVEVHTLRQKLYKFIKLADRIKETSFSLADFLKQVPTVYDIKTWDVSYEELDEEEFDDDCSDKEGADWVKRGRDIIKTLDEVEGIKDCTSIDLTGSYDKGHEELDDDNKSSKEVNLNIMNDTGTNP